MNKSRNTFSKTGIIALPLAAAVLAALLVSCGGRNAVSFRNDTGLRLQEVYISDPGRDNWGAPVNSSPLRAGGRLTLELSDLAGDGGTVCDLGALDERGTLYEIFGVSLAAGDILTLSAEGDTAALTVTDPDGADSRYEGPTVPADDWRPPAQDGGE